MRLDAAQADADVAAKIDHGHWTGHERYGQRQDCATGIIINGVPWTVESVDAALDRLDVVYRGRAGHVGQCRVTTLESVSTNALNAPRYVLRCPK
jgi:hypothetical protein